MRYIYGMYYNTGLPEYIQPLQLTEITNANMNIRKVYLLKRLNIC